MGWVFDVADVCIFTLQMCESFGTCDGENEQQNRRVLRKDEKHNAMWELWVWKFGTIPCK